MKGTNFGQETSTFTALVCILSFNFHIFEDKVLTHNDDEEGQTCICIFVYDPFM